MIYCARKKKKKKRRNIDGSDCVQCRNLCRNLPYGDSFFFTWAYVLVAGGSLLFLSSSCTCYSLSYEMRARFLQGQDGREDISMFSHEIRLCGRVNLDQESGFIFGYLKEHIRESVLTGLLTVPVSEAVCFSVKILIILICWETCKKNI